MKVICENCKSGDVVAFDYQSKWEKSDGYNSKWKENKDAKTKYSCNKCGHNFESKVLVLNYKEKPVLKVEVDFSVYSFEIIKEFSFSKGTALNVRIFSVGGYNYQATVFNQDVVSLFKTGEIYGMSITANLQYDKNNVLKLHFN